MRGIITGQFQVLKRELTEARVPAFGFLAESIEERFLRSVARRAQTARKKSRATPVEMTGAVFCDRASLGMLRLAPLTRWTYEANSRNDLTMIGDGGINRGRGYRDEPGKRHS
jgi:hypothetical protein